MNWKFYKSCMASMLAILSLTTITSCSKDKDEEPDGVPAAKSIAGVYAGDMICSVMGNESTFEDMTISVTPTDDSTATIEISEFGEAQMKVSAITVAGVKVSGSDGTYSLATTTFSGDIGNGKTYSGTLEGNCSSGNLTVRFNLQYGAMPMPMICSFTGQKQ